MSSRKTPSFYHRSRHYFNYHSGCGSFLNTGEGVFSKRYELYYRIREQQLCDQ